MGSCCRTRQTVVRTFKTRTAVLIRAKAPGAHSAILQNNQPDRCNSAPGCAVMRPNLVATTIYNTDFAEKIHESMDRLE